MFEFFKKIFNSDFMPHGHCYFWDPAIVWTNAISDGIISLSYFTIPFTLIYILRNRKDLKFMGLLILFSIFILGCGITHIMDVINIWNPIYRLDSFFRAITALASISTAFMLVKISPQILLIPNFNVFEKVNNDLKKQLEELKIKDKTIELLKHNKRVEDTLKETEERFSVMANNIPNLAWMAKADGWIFWYNKRWFEYTGKNQSDMDGWGWQSVHDPKILPFVMEKWGGCIKTGEPFEMTFPLKGHDGEYRQFLTRVVPVKNEAGEIINWFGTNTDVSVHLKNENLLKAQNDELMEFRKLAIDEMQNKSLILNGILDHTPVIVYKINYEGVITDAYGSALNSLFPKQNIRGKIVSDIFPSISGSDIENLTENSNSYLTHWKIGNKEWYYDNYFFPDRVSNKGVIGIGMDITDLKELSLQLQIEKEKAVNASFFKTRFLANMSHEIRTPLNAIIGFSNALAEQKLSEEQQQEYLAHITSSGSLLLNLIGDILDLSKIEEGKLSLINESFDFKEVVTSAIQPYKYKANEKGLFFNYYFDEFIPPYVIGDAYRIKQIIINLIGNALKFTKHGGVTLVFSTNQIVTKTEICNIQMEIRDTGIGIDDEKKEKIFESFTQADSTINRQYEGSGLGLSIVKQIVDLMKGEIRVEDNKQSIGSIFFLMFPLIIDQTHVKTILQDKGTSKKSLHFNNNIYVLVVEDNVVNQKLVAIVLRKLGAKFDFANNGQEAIAMFKVNNYDVILMDVQMPVMNGLEASKIIRKTNRSIPIIALTANVYKDDIDNTKAAGMNDHLPKPFTESQIYETIIKSLNKKKYTDLSYLNMISNGDDLIYNSLIKNILSQNKTYLKNLQDSLNIQDWNAVNTIIHQWKSSSKILGITLLFQICIEIEEAIINMNSEYNFPKTLEEIKVIFEAVERELELS